ncbi:MAG TPA: hypothetical protein VFE50_03275 [Cyclobacteriaceae bacterium]|nr:hypothetical protein [Cyclobacteriaceae bacterium]
MKKISALVLVCLCACSTGEKSASDADSTSATTSSDATLATTPSVTSNAETEPDPVINEPSSPDEEYVKELLSQCPMDVESRGDIENLDDSTVWNMAMIAGDLKSVMYIENFLDADNLSNPRPLVAAVIVTQETITHSDNMGAEQEYTVLHPAILVFEHRGDNVVHIAQCELPTWTGKPNSDGLMITEPLVVGSMSVVELGYDTYDVVDIDHPIEKLEIAWYGLVKDKIVKIFEFTPHYKEHVGAGDGENSTEYGSDVELAMKNLNDGKLRLLELTTTANFDSEEDPAKEKPDGIYAFNGVYYVKVERVE